VSSLVLEEGVVLVVVIRGAKAFPADKTKVNNTKITKKFLITTSYLFEVYLIVLLIVNPWYIITKLH